MFLFREAGWDDEDAIYDLARYLNTLNLPPERAFIHELLERSLASFDGLEDFNQDRRFVFVLEDPDGKVIGTSMIHAQHGTFDQPHVFFTVTTEERHGLLGPIPDDEGEERFEHVHMEHTMLYLSQTYKGPSELGGLVMHPDWRGHPERLGRLLSLGRFVFIAAFRSWIRDRLLAELLPPLYEGPGGSTMSPLWDALGRRFTGLSYTEADRLSRINKSFIWDLFPRMPVQASLLPESVQKIIGTVGPNTVGALQLLESVGFRYTGRVDPFDGGPHVEAETDSVTLVRDARAYRAEPGEPVASALPAIVGTRSESFPHFRAISTPVLAPDDAEVVRLSAAAMARLGLAEDDPESQAYVSLRPQRRRGDSTLRRAGM